MNVNAEDTGTEQSLDAFEKEFYGREDVQETPEVEAEIEVEPVTEEATNDENDVATDDTDEELPEEKPKKRKSPEDRIKEVVAKQRQAERDLAEALAKLEVLETRAQPEKAPVDTNRAEDGRPDPNATLENGDPAYPLGEFDPNYILDLNKFMFQEQVRVFREEEAQKVEAAKLAAEREVLNATWQQKVATAEETMPDIREKVVVLDEITEGLPKEQLQYLAETIMAMDAGPEVLYYLADNPDEAEVLISADPRTVALRLGRLEGIVLSGKTKEEGKKRVTGAPPPPATQTRGASGKFEIPDDTDDLAAFEKKYYKK